jgi:hypothetical protein
MVFLSEFEYSRQIKKKYILTLYSMKFRPVEADLFQVHRQTDRQTDLMIVIGAYLQHTRRQLKTTRMIRMTAFRLKTDRIYDSGPIKIAPLYRH